MRRQPSLVSIMLSSLLTDLDTLLSDLVDARLRARRTGPKDILREVIEVVDDPRLERPERATERRRFCIR